MTLIVRTHMVLVKENINHNLFIILTILCLAQCTYDNALASYYCVLSSDVFMNV